MFVFLINVFPLKQCVKSKKYNNRWFTKDLHKMCKQKCELYKKYLKDPIEYKKDKYNKYRNMVNGKIKKLK